MSPVSLSCLMESQPGCTSWQLYMSFTTPERLSGALVAGLVVTSDAFSSSTGPDASRAAHDDLGAAFRIGIGSGSALGAPRSGNASSLISNFGLGATAGSMFLGLRIGLGSTFWSSVNLRLPSLLLNALPSDDFNASKRLLVGSLLVFLRARFIVLSRSLDDY